MVYKPVKVRLRSTRHPGLHPVVGLLVFAGTTAVLGGIAEEVVKQKSFTIADAQLSMWFHAYRSPHFTTFMWVVTSLHSTLAVSSSAVVVGLYLWWRRRPYWLAAVWLSVFGGMFLNKILKYSFHRPRPYFDDPILTLTSYSFPSGHTMMATVFYGALAAFLIAQTIHWPWRVLVILTASFLIALVGFTRIYLGAHYLSDVLAAMAEGLAWLSLCLTAVYSVWQRRQQMSL